MRALLVALLLVGACSVVPDRGSLPAAPASRPRVQTVMLGYELEDYRDSLAGAMDLWNEAIGWEALVWADYDGTEPDVLVVVGEPAHGWLGSANARQGLIRYRMPGDAYQAYLVFAHELGHAAFWLADDPDHGYSVMAGVGGAADPDHGILWPAQRHVAVTEADAARVRRLLGER